MKKKLINLTMIALMLAPLCAWAQDSEEYEIWLDQPSFSLQNDTLQFYHYNNYAETQIVYSIDYADDALTDVNDALYTPDVPIIISGGCLVYAYCRLREVSSDTARAVYYEVTMPNDLVYSGDTIFVKPDIYPALMTDEGHTLHYEFYQDYPGLNGMRYDDETGEEQLYIYGPGNHAFTIEIWGGETCSILNSTEWVTLKVRPAAPTFDPEGGIFDEVVTFKIAAAGMNDMTSIHYQIGNQRPETYTDSVMLGYSATVKAWVETYASGRSFSSDTVTAKYIIRQQAQLKWVDPQVMTHMVEITADTTRIGDEYTQPDLYNPQKLEVLFASSNEHVATIDKDGRLTIAGAGQTTISATHAADSIYTEATAAFVLTVEALLERIVTDTDNDEAPEEEVSFTSDNFIDDDTGEQNDLSNVTIDNVLYTLGDDAGHYGTGHRRAALGAVGEVLPRHHQDCDVWKSSR